MTQDIPTTPDATPEVLVLLPVSDAQRARLEAAAPGARFTYDDKVLVDDEKVARANVIIGNLRPQRLALATSLELMQLNSAGYDAYVTAPLAAGARLASATGAYGQAVSEHMFAMLLAMIKRLPAYRDCQRAHEWADLGDVTSLKGARVLVLGAGDIGSHFARLCEAFGARVTGFRRHPNGTPEGFEQVLPTGELAGHLGSADVVVSFLPSTPETRGLVDKDFLAAMPRGSYLVNGGRGDLVVEQDLVDALASGHIAGAALDVTSPEPLPETSPLWDAPGAFVTPHVAGQFHLAATLDNIVDIAAENLRRHLAGMAPINLVAR